MKPLLFSLFFLTSFICLSQANSDLIYFASMQNKIIELDIKPDNNSLPFGNIEIWDARPDTTSIGFLYSKTASKTFKLIFKRGLSNQFSEFVNKNYQLNFDDTINTLLIIIKNFRVSEYVSTLSVKKDNVVEWNSGALLSEELFLNNGKGYHALYKIDSTILAPTKSESIADMIVQSFKTVLKKAENKKLSEMHVGKTEFSYADVRKHAFHSFDDHILTDDELNKGVYITFNEFKNNKPSIQEYELRKGKFTDELFVTEGMQSYPLQNFWGYCDGQNIYIRSADNLFQLLRTGKTFNTRAAKSLSKKSTDIVADVVGAAVTLATGIPVQPHKNIQYKGTLIGFQLDMQTGEIF